MGPAICWFTQGGGIAVGYLKNNFGISLGEKGGQRKRGSGTFCAKHRAPTEGWSGPFRQKVPDPFFHTMQITNPQPYTGATNITGGTLRFTSTGSFSTFTDVTVNSATWDLNNISDTVDSISGNSGGVIDLGTATLHGRRKQLKSHLQRQNSRHGQLRQERQRHATLTGNNTYDGTTTLDQGILRVASSSNLGDGELIFDSATLNTTGSFTNGRSLSINSGDFATLDVNSSTTLIQSGQISGGSTTTLNKTGGGTFRTTSSNGVSFSGDIVVTNGTFDMAGGGDALGNSTTVTVNSPGIFLVNNPDDIGGLAGTGNGSVDDNQALRVGHDNASTTFSVIISGSSVFGKRGSGTLG